MAIAGVLIAAPQAHAAVKLSARTTTVVDPAAMFAALTEHIGGCWDTRS